MRPAHAFDNALMLALSAQTRPCALPAHLDFRDRVAVPLPLRRCAQHVDLYR
jgi:hypothetical protein